MIILPRLKLAHLYSKSLNLYGDIGNILSLLMRARWRGINFEIEKIEIGDHQKSLLDFDLFFIGGGQDSQQEEVSRDLIIRRNEFISAIDLYKPMLAVCGGYQLLGNYYQDSSGHQIPGLGVLDIRTEAKLQKKGEKQSRLVGNIKAELLMPLIHSQNPLRTLVGFENHSGRTFIDSDKAKPLAKVIRGYGNNALDKFEGAYYKNLIGTYLHGSLLPKNPHLTDEILFRAILNKEKDFQPEDFPSLDSGFELLAHKKALNLK
jgi:lipid II isoglutaminyl synthase (glutamine-hydrolysing)